MVAGINIDALYIQMSIFRLHYQPMHDIDLYTITTCPQCQAFQTVNLSDGAIDPWCCFIIILIIKYYYGNRLSAGYQTLGDTSYAIIFQVHCKKCYLCVFTSNITVAT